MFLVTGNLLLVRQELSLNQLILAGFAVLLVVLLGFLLYKKLKRLQQEHEEDDDDNEVPSPVKPAIEPALNGTPIKPTITFKAAAPQPEPAPLATPMSAPVPTPQPDVVTMPEPVQVLQPEMVPPVQQVNYATELPLSKSTNEINAILNSLSDIIFEYDENKVCINLWYNKAISLVIDLEMFRGKTVTEAIGESKAKMINNALDRVALTKQPTTIEFLSFFGSGKWFQSHISPVFDASGMFTGKTTSLVTDITERKELDTIVKEKQQRLVAAQKIAKLGDWWYDLNLKKTYWSDNLYQLLDIDELPRNASHFEYYISRVISEDRRSVYQFFGDIAGKTHQSVQHKIVTAKHNECYFRIVRGEPIKDGKGQITRVTGIIQDVTESRINERTIKKSQAELREAQTIAKIGNWKWYLGQRKIGWSNEVYHIYEVSPQAVASSNSHFKLLMRFVHHDDRATLLSFLRNPGNMHRSSVEFRIITPSGKMKYVNLIVVKVIEALNGTPRSVTGTIQDITERKAAEMQYRQTEDNYKTVLESIKLAALTLDKSGNIIFCNKHLANLLGYQQDQLIGINWFGRFVPQNMHHVFAGWYKKQNIESNFVNPVICRGGELRTISWQNTTVYDENGAIAQTTSIGEDITEQQKAREELISAKEAAERSSRFKSEFLSTMSHEIRTPLNAVIGNTNLLIEENPRLDQLPYLNNLKFSSENLLGIIDDILDYNKIEAGKLELSNTQLDVHTLVANIKQAFQAKASEKFLSLQAEIDQQIPQNLIGDPIRISQILNNLVSNAIKFTHKGGVTMLVREEGRNDKFVKLNFTVADTGIGIDEQNLNRIFEPFVQESQQRRDYGGSGLGLAIIKKLVELHGSQIKANSSLGKGSQFSFTIDFEYTAEPATTPKLNPVQKMQEGDLAGMKVLLVDDNKMNIMIASRFLTKWNVEISEAYNGLIATEMVQSNDYDLIIMDLQMPVMDGFEATRIIKQRNPQIPVIALTADAMPETFKKAQSYGIDDYLTKPFMPETLFEKVSRHYRPVFN